jgi:hypothetical protein
LPQGVSNYTTSENYRLQPIEVRYET